MFGCPVTQKSGLAMESPVPNYVGMQAEGLKVVPGEENQQRLTFWWIALLHLYIPTMPASSTICVTATPSMSASGTPALL